jgi:carboxymethylenebutenolidase
MAQEIQLTASDGGTFAAFLALPEKRPAPGLVLLPEVFNTNPHIHAVADGYAAAGFVVLAPDVYWRQEPGCYCPYTDEGRAKAASLRAQLDTDQFTRDLGEMVAALRARPECSGKVAVMGFCLGGKFAYLAATRLPIDAAVAYYGVEIDKYLDEADRLRCPLLMHFAETDPHVPPATVAAIRARMGGMPRVTIHQDYAGSEHGFNRQGYPPYQEVSAQRARERTLAHLCAM